jgi:hypothetical protein
MVANKYLQRHNGGKEKEKICILHIYTASTPSLTTTQLEITPKYKFMQPVTYRQPFKLNSPSTC